MWCSRWTKRGPICTVSVSRWSARLLRGSSNVLPAIGPGRVRRLHRQVHRRSRMPNFDNCNRSLLHLGKINEQITTPDIDFFCTTKQEQLLLRM